MPPNINMPPAPPTQCWALQLLQSQGTGGRVEPDIFRGPDCAAAGAECKVVAAKARVRISTVMIRIAALLCDAVDAERLLAANAAGFAPLDGPARDRVRQCLKAGHVGSNASADVGCGAVYDSSGPRRGMSASRRSRTFRSAPSARVLRLDRKAHREKRGTEATRATYKMTSGAMRQKPHFTRCLKHITPVQSCREKYSSFAFPKIMIV
jgi:hypothetical protein